MNSSLLHQTVNNQKQMMVVELRLCLYDKQLLPFEITLYRASCLSNSSVYPSQYRFFPIISHLNILFVVVVEHVQNTISCFGMRKFLLTI